ncbi:MAG: hypothetical protein LBD88_02350 [Candidatus Peribacteria bacterium]|nr:hypothetical protein [Candidatus Peribacteria bacterium]
MYFIFMDIKELEWHLNIPFWNYKGTYNLKPIDVIKDKIKYSKEYNRAIAANLNYPIDIMENK